MNLRTFLATALLSLALLACSRNDDDSPQDPNNPNPPGGGGNNPASGDTLSAGWSRQSTGLGGNLADVFFTDSLRGYTCSDMGIFYSGNGGRSWTPVTVPGGSTRPFVNIGAWNGLAVVADLSNELTRTINPGSSVRTAQVATGGGNPSFRDVFFISATHSYAASQQHFWRSADGGVTFDTVHRFASNIPDNAALFFLDANRGWISRLDGLHQTTDGGVTWTRVSNIGGTAGGVHFLPDGQTGFFTVGSFVFKTTDGGSTRIPLSLPGITASQSGLADLYFFDAQNGYVSVQNKIFRTSDGGATWTLVARTAQPLVELHFTDPQHGWACGLNGTMLRFQQP
ncbi:hypothetical protein [Flaviaesturariibacter amylovorans]|uniref:Photosynthesis system II assembly factor Ycf48/Hcf136-like domain-containing protein n=1 Tax=Flaviaesturariibacter amylovorans TaxID=1084520 RepID=A0ABP8HU96_9BACT